MFCLQMYVYMHSYIPQYIDRLLTVDILKLRFCFPCNSILANIKSDRKKKTLIFTYFFSLSSQLIIYALKKITPRLRGLKGQLIISHNSWISGRKVVCRALIWLNMQVPCLEWRIYDGSFKYLGVGARCHLDYSLHVVSHHPSGYPDVLRQWGSSTRRQSPKLQGLLRSRLWTLHITSSTDGYFIKYLNSYFSKGIIDLLLNFLFFFFW
mgnify:CR=1 FL=1